MRLVEQIALHGLLNVFMNLVQIILKAFLVWVAFQIWADVRLVKERQERHETWVRCRDWEEAEEKEEENAEQKA